MFFEMFYWVQVRDLAGPLRRIHRVVLRQLLLCLCYVLKVIVLVDVLRVLDQVFIKDKSVLCPIQLSLNPEQSPRPCCWQTTLKHDAASTIFPFWRVFGMKWVVPGYLQTWRLELRPNSSILVHQPREVCFSQSECPLGASFFCRLLHRREFCLATPP